MEKKATVNLPKGKLCGNCSTCLHYEPRNTDRQGRGYCPKRGHHYFPSEREGCFSYERR